MITTGQKINSLTQAAATSPEYASITPLFEAIYRYIDGKEEQTGITITVAESTRIERLAKGFPMISPLDLSVDSNALTTFLTGAAAVLKANGTGAGESLERIVNGLNNGSCQPGDMIVAILERHRAPIDETAARLDVPPPLLEYLFEIPLKTALELYSATISDDVSAWHEALCPVCGSRPGMAELVGDGGRKMLSCSACFFKWPFKRLKCPSCGSENSDDLSYFSVEGGTTRVDSCKACSRYIKTRDSRKGAADTPLEIEDLLTIHLDLMASKEGLERGK